VDVGVTSLNALSEQVIGAAITVHRELGPGFTESVYENALCVQLHEAGVQHERQAQRHITYRNQHVGEVRLDLVVCGILVVELKAVDRLADLHTAQVLSYLKAARLPLGLLINFNVPLLTRGVKRIINTIPSNPL